MRTLLPALALLVVGCGSDRQLHSPPTTASVMNPRPLEPTWQEDRILQVTQPEVDVLWVVDDSCSMDGEQAALSENFPRFFDFFEGSGLDYHIGVVSTDMDNPMRQGRLVIRRGHHYIDPQTPDAARVFSEMVMLGISGSGDERGNDATHAALETHRDGHNLGFLRENSGVHVVVVSDEQDYSKDITPDELASYLDGLRRDPDDVTHSSIVLANDTRYRHVTERVGGILWDISQPDWTVVLEQLGLQAAGLKREYFLSQLPVPGTIEVGVVDGTYTYAFAEGADWAYHATRNSISFHEFVPTPMSEVVIRYEVLSSHHGD